MGVEALVVENVDWFAKKARHYYPYDAHEAEDLASETMYKCLSQAKKFDRERDFKPWAQTIMHNTYITAYNRRKCVQFHPLEECSNPPISPRHPLNAITDYGHADHGLSVKEILSIIRECGRQSANIECVLLYAEGYDYHEIADKVGIPYGTVKSRVANGRKVLRDALADWDVVGKRQ